jgi:hypothetical protein
MKPDDNSKRRMTIVAWLFVAPFLVSFLGLGLVFVGLIARHSESSAHWGIWCSIIGWSVTIAGLVLRPLAKRLEKRWRD